MATAFESDEELDSAIRCVVKADLAIFDVTGFEPGVLLLMGVRAAVRRGLSISSYGAGWKEGEPLPPPIPFNLNDLQIGSHTPIEIVGAEPVVDRLVERITVGFAQLARQPRYLDLPAFDALRQLGPAVESSGTISWRKQILFLCPYNREYGANRRLILRQIRGRLQDDHGVVTPKLLRVIDLGSPQLISQSLYEHIRRASACLMDWTTFNPSAFLELGVRLAVSPWGAVQLLDGGAKEPPLQQIPLLKKRFDPIVYSAGDGASREPFGLVVKEIVGRDPLMAGDTPRYGWVQAAVKEALEDIAESVRPVHEELREQADSLQDPQQAQRGTTRLLFHESRRVKADSERAACERRLAAWLYLEHRLKAGRASPHDPLRVLYRELGTAVAKALLADGTEEDAVLADEINEKVRDL